MRRLTAIIFTSTLLFSYQKGDIISPDISKKMKLEAGKDICNRLFCLMV